VGLTDTLIVVYRATVVEDRVLVTAGGYGGLPRGAKGLVSLVVVFLIFGVVPAHAEKRRVRLTLAPMYALAIVDRRDPSGGGVNADLAFGITDSLSVRATGFVSFHAASGIALPQASDSTEGRFGPTGTLAAFGAFAGINYELPVLRIVPSFDLGVGVLGLRGDPRFGTGADAAALLPSVTAFAVELGFGVDWLVTQRWSVGVVVRYHALLTELERAPSFLYIGPRASVSLPF